MRSFNTLTSAVLLSLGLTCVALALGSQAPGPLILAAIGCLAAFALIEYEDAAETASASLQG